MMWLRRAGRTPARLWRDGRRLSCTSVKLNFGDQIGVQSESRNESGNGREKSKPLPTPRVPVPDLSQPERSGNGEDDWTGRINDLGAQRMSTVAVGTAFEFEAVAALEQALCGPPARSATERSVAKKWEGVVVGRVVSCEIHPNADRLRVVEVDVGQEQPLVIICGAPNVAVGQLVPVATVGTVLPLKSAVGALAAVGADSTFKIKKSKLRGIVSHGMICAEDELGLGNDHDGIMILEGGDTTYAGMPLCDFLSALADQSDGPRPVLMDAGQASGIRLRVRGGAGDAGVDFSGEWSIGSKRVFVLGQCKHEQKKLGPRSVREFGGVLSEYKRGIVESKFTTPSSEKNDTSQPLGASSSLPSSSPSQSMPTSSTGDIIGLLVSRSSFTADALRTARTAVAAPLICCVVENQAVKQFTLNSAAQQLLGRDLQIATLRETSEGRELVFMERSMAGGLLRLGNKKRGAFEISEK